MQTIHKRKMIRKLSAVEIPLQWRAVVDTVLTILVFLIFCVYFFSLIYC